MQVAYFLNGPIFDLLFYCHINSYWKKVTSYEKFSNNLTPELQIVRKFQYFKAINWSMKMLKNGWIKKKFKKIMKLFTRSKQWKCKLRASLQPTPYQIKSSYVFGTKVFSRWYTEIYKHLLSRCFNNAVLGIKKWYSANVFSNAKQKHVCWKFCKVRKFFCCVAGAYYFQCQVSWGS